MARRSIGPIRRPKRRPQHLASVSRLRPELFQANPPSARATSAAPIYFQPYYHRKTRHIYTDGALRRNNPIRFADEERRLIWPKGNNRPDIILSVGTGIQVQASGGMKQAEGSKVNMLRKLLPRGLQKNIATAYDMLLSTLSCEKEWDDFIDAHRHDPKFIKSCHRLNVGLTGKPPKLDDIGSIPLLESEARDYLSSKSPQRQTNTGLDRGYVNAHQHIRTVARRLKSALFYFDEVHTSPEKQDTTSTNLHRISGYIKCRLSPTMTPQFASLLKSRPVFRVCEREDTFREVSQPKFDLESFSSDLVDLFLSPGCPIDKWRVEVRFSEYSSIWECISGFS